MSNTLKNKRNTNVYPSSIVYHGTIILYHAEDGRVALNSQDWDGKAWRTATTKQKINLGLSLWGYPWRVHQEGKKWWVRSLATQAVYGYRDGMTITINGHKPPTYVEQAQAVDYNGSRKKG